MAGCGSVPDGSPGSSRAVVSCRETWSRSAWIPRSTSLQHSWESCGRARCTCRSIRMHRPNGWRLFSPKQGLMWWSPAPGRNGRGAGPPGCPPACPGSRSRSPSRRAAAFRTSGPGTTPPPTSPSPRGPPAAPRGWWFRTAPCTGWSSTQLLHDRAGRSGGEPVQPGLRRHDFRTVEYPHRRSNGRRFPGRYRSSGGRLDRASGR